VSARSTNFLHVTRLWWIVKGLPSARCEPVPRPDPHPGARPGSGAIKQRTARPAELQAKLGPPRPHLGTAGRCDPRLQSRSHVTEAPHRVDSILPLNQGPSARREATNSRALASSLRRRSRRSIPRRGCRLVGSAPTAFPSARLPPSLCRSGQRAHNHRAPFSAFRGAESSGRSKTIGRNARAQP